MLLKLVHFLIYSFKALFIPIIELFLLPVLILISNLFATFASEYKMLEHNG